MRTNRPEGWRRGSSCTPRLRTPPSDPHEVPITGGGRASPRRGSPSRRLASVARRHRPRRITRSRTRRRPPPEREVRGERLARSSRRPRGAGRRSNPELADARCRAGSSDRRGHSRFCARLTLRFARRVVQGWVRPGGRRARDRDSTSPPGGVMATSSAVRARGGLAMMSRDQRSAPECRDSAGVRGGGADRGGLKAGGRARPRRRSTGARRRRAAYEHHRLVVCRRRPFAEGERGGRTVGWPKGTEHGWRAGKGPYAHMLVSRPSPPSLGEDPVEIAAAPKGARSPCSRPSLGSRRLPHH